MKKRMLALLMAALCLMLCACGSSEEAAPQATDPSSTAAVEEIPETIVPETTVPETTEAPTEPAPRVPGPEKIEAEAVTIENVTVEYIDQLPKSFKSTTAYSTYGGRDKLILDESQVYAVIRFRITNKMPDQIQLADIHDEFLIELIYDNSYVYTTDSDAHTAFTAGSQAAIMTSTFRLGKMALSPLASADVTLYLPCARVVSEDTEHPLSVVFTSTYAGYENLEFIIR